ncbi:MAG TPA: POTRA domain-containing protein [Vicinamibacterales bacterium]
MPGRSIAPLAGIVALLASALVPPQVAAQPAAPVAEAPPVSDVSAFAGETIVEVSLERSGRPVTDDRWLALIETKPGEALSVREARETLRHFFHTGLFESVDVIAAAATDGVRLRYRLVPVRVVSGFSFSGDLGLSRGELRRAVAERFGDRPAPARAAAAGEVVEALLRERGYTSARVTPTIEPDANDETVTMRFAVEAGARARIGRIEITGEPLETPARIQEQLGIAPGAYYDGPEIERRLERLRNELRRRGYYEATAIVRATPQPGSSTVDVIVDVQPGPLVTLQFTGDPVPQDRRAELVPVEREASVDEDLLEDSKRRIEAWLHESGHWRSEVTYRRETSPGHVTIVFDVRAGDVYRVASVQVEGVRSLPRQEIDAVLRLRAGDLFVEGALDSRTAALVERYRRAGFRDVRIEQIVEELEPDKPGDGRVAVRLFVNEGQQVRIGRIEITGEERVTEDDLRPKLQLRPGGPFYEPLIASDREALAGVYLDRGYDRARIESLVTPAGAQQVDVTFDVQEGEQVRVGRILIVGNRRTDTATIERALALEPGEPLGLSQILESQRRLRALGLFRRVTLTDVGEPGNPRRDLVVTVEEAAPTSIGYGAGIEAGRYLRQDFPGGQANERIELAGRGFFEIGRQNLFGSNRSVNLFTRISLRPSGVPQTDGADFGFNEYRVLMSFRDPSVFGVADTRVTGYFEQAVRSSFNFVRRGILAEAARRVRERISLAASYSLSEVRLFDERIAPEDRPDIDRLFPQLRLSKVSFAVRRDTRDDLLDPTTGLVTGLEGDVAGRRIGSQVGFVKGYGELFAYRQLTQKARLVLAGGVRLGLARGFERTTPRLNEEGAEVFGPGGEPLIDLVSDLPASERFFAGGDTTVRGFARDSLGTAGTLDPNGFPTGGNGLVVLNAELRAPIWRELGGVVFLDAGNVFRRAADIDLGELRTSAGFGLRYRSPIGPIRFDIGFKLDDPVRQPNGREPGYAVHFSLGQAF